MNVAKKRVLLVDDHPKLAKFIQLGLMYDGFEVTTVTSGQEGLNATRASKPDIMLLDVRMPDMDGFEVLRQLRQFSTLPVIVYSATPEYSTLALKAGADAFLAKPFEMDELTELIKKLTNHRS